MAQNSLYPAFVQINYHSQWGQHIQTVPTRTWTPGAGANDPGFFEAWNGTQRDAGEMVEEFCTGQAAFFPATVVMDSFYVYTMATPTSSPIPQVAIDLTIPGTAVAAGWSKATQATWSFKTTAFGIFKVVQLDVNNQNNFDKLLAGGLNAAGQAFVALIGSQSNAWSGRDGNRPSQFRQIAYTLNEKLRRQYNMN